MDGVQMHPNLSAAVIEPHLLAILAGCIFSVMVCMEW